MTSNTISLETPFDRAMAKQFSARANISQAQRAGFEQFQQSGVPSRRVEGWRWSDFHAALREWHDEDARQDVAVDIAPSAFGTLAPLEIRLGNGWAEMPDLDDSGVTLSLVNGASLTEQAGDHALRSLNAAMTDNVLIIDIAEGVNFAQPILIRHIASGAPCVFSRIVLKVGAHACATLIESFEGTHAGYGSHFAHGDIGKEAQLTRYVLDTGNAGALRHGMMCLSLAEGAQLSQTSFSRGGVLVRHETHVQFTGEEARATINSASLLRGECHADFTTHVGAEAPSCTVRQLHKAVAKDQGKAIFQGKFLVDRPAQKTDAQMTANAMLLSDRAEANHKPELEIYADDVECAHGSTAGALDDDALFYLRQRGLSEAAARALLIEAFVGEVVDAIEDERVRDVFSAEVQSWLTQA